MSHHDSSCLARSNCGLDAFRSFSLTAARRLASGSPVFNLLAEAAPDECEEGVVPPSPLVRGRFLSLGDISPVSATMVCSERKPGIENTWKVSARSRVVAARHRTASSSYICVSMLK